jgi:hypothetical protein
MPIPKKGKLSTNCSNIFKNFFSILPKTYPRGGLKFVFYFPDDEPGAAASVPVIQNCLEST